MSTLRNTYNTHISISQNERRYDSINYQHQTTNVALQVGNMNQVCSVLHFEGEYLIIEEPRWPFDRNSFKIC